MSQILFLLLQLALAQGLLACPDGTTAVHGGNNTWCITPINTTLATFCDAIKSCHAQGAEMISKAVFDVMRTKTGAFGSSGQWWVGLVDSLNERGKKRDGWVWIKTGEMTESSINYFHSVEPNDNKQQDCVTISKVDSRRIVLRDDGCLELNPYYCYVDPTVLRTNPASFSFKKVDIKVTVQPDPGCSIRAANVPSTLDCSIVCYTFGPDCVGFYHSVSSRACVILPYFDAAVQLRSSGDPWVKFVRWIDGIV